MGQEGLIADRQGKRSKNAGRNLRTFNLDIGVRILLGSSSNCDLRPLVVIIAVNFVPVFVDEGRIAK